MRTDAARLNGAATALEVSSLGGQTGQGCKRLQVDVRSGSGSDAVVPLRNDTRVNERQGAVAALAFGGWGRGVTSFMRRCPTPAASTRSRGHVGLVRQYSGLRLNLATRLEKSESPLSEWFQPTCRLELRTRGRSPRGWILRPSMHPRKTRCSTSETPGSGASIIGGAMIWPRWDLNAYRRV